MSYAYTQAYNDGWNAMSNALLRRRTFGKIYDALVDEPCWYELSEDDQDDFIQHVGRIIAKIKVK